MVDINYTLLVQLANFLFLVIVLNFLLFKPVLKHLNDRDMKISGQQEEAGAFADKAQAMLQDFERELADARVKANQTYHAFQQEGMAGQRERLGKAKAEAQAMLEKAKAEVAGEAAKAREVLEKEMAKLPGEIASKLLGRPV